MGGVWGVIAVSLIIAAPARADDVRLRGLNAVDAYFAAGPGRMLAGDQVLLGFPEELDAWAVTGGKPQKLASLPDLGPAENNLTDGGGFERVEVAEPGRVVVVRGDGSPLAPEFDTHGGHQLVVGPPAGPFEDPAGCGETTGMPADLSGDRLVYQATPGRTCAPTVAGRSLVVRDLADGNAVVRVIPVAGKRVDAVQMAGPFVAYIIGGAKQQLVEENVDTGEELLRLPAVGQRPFALDADGVVVAGKAVERRGSRCFAPIEDVRRYRPGETTGTPLGVRACSIGYFGIDDGALRYTEPRPDGRSNFRSLDLAKGTSSTLATVSGLIVDADATHALAQDDSCMSQEVRVVTLGTGSAPSGPLRCPARLVAPRAVDTVRHRRIALRLRCPKGCSADVEVRTGDRHHPTFGDAQSFTVHARPGVLTFHVLALYRPRNRAALERVSLTINNPAAGPTRLRTTIRLRPTHRSDLPVDYLARHGR